MNSTYAFEGSFVSFKLWQLSDVSTNIFPFIHLNSIPVSTSSLPSSDCPLLQVKGYDCSPLLRTWEVFFEIFLGLPYKREIDKSSRRSLRGLGNWGT